tara:strand:+ start:102 stop:254 length:153 start_codon:yes stop_codon:yes gene_type:complete
VLVEPLSVLFHQVPDKVMWVVLQFFQLFHQQVVEVVVMEKVVQQPLRLQV